MDLDLSDGPARASRLFLIDGNSLAYRAYYALPEELATTDGFPSNALLGFANMLMRLLTDYHPEGVVVASGGAAPTSGGAGRVGAAGSAGADAAASGAADATLPVSFFPQEAAARKHTPTRATKLRVPMTRV